MLDACNRWWCSRSTPVAPNETWHPLDVFSFNACRIKWIMSLNGNASLDTCRSECNVALVDSNELWHHLVMLSLDTCRAEWKVAPRGDDLARHLPIEMNFCTLWWCTRSTRVDPTAMRQQLVENTWLLYSIFQNKMIVWRWTPNHIIKKTFNMLILFE